MSSKGTHKYTVSGGKKETVLGFLEELQGMPQHSWIPIEEMQDSNRATVTPRQAGWLVNQVERRVEGRTLAFELIEEPAEAESA